MNNPTHLKTLLAGTALTVAFAVPSMAQTLNVNVEELAGKSAECRALGQFIADQDGSVAGVEPTRVADAVNSDNAAECVEIQDLLMAQAGATAETASETAETEAEATTESVETSQEATIVGEAVVRVPEPNVDVRVPRPEVIVRKAPPQVSVQDGAAQIDVQQARPEIAVEIPTINVRVTMPAPSIYVLQDDPQVSVTEADPQVEVVQGEPEIIVTQPDPQLDIEMGLAEGGQAPADQAETDTANADGAQQVSGNVDLAQQQPIVSFVAAAEQPQVEITRAEPEISFSGVQPNVTVTMTEEPTVDVQMAGEPQITIETPEEREQRRAAMQADAAGAAPAAEGQRTAGAQGQMTVGDVKRLIVVTADGQELGNPQGVMDMDGQQYILLTSGEALGMGSGVVPVPVARMTMEGDRMVMGEMTDEDRQRAQDFQYDENAVMADDQPVMATN